ncbi:MAG: 50S ribosomal protein L22 [Candidatus Sumerlaeota bacterium]|nr:50S ribosomal protein L22 [Candidatus Sumerlaeota bacterium]
MPSDQFERAQRRRETREADHKDRGVASVAQVRYARVSTRKARMIADLVRGKRVDEAMSMLKFTHRPSIVPAVERLLKCAVAGVDRHAHSSPEELYIGRMWVDSAGMLKRWRPRAFGRAARIRKRMCHISLELVERP